MSSMRERLAVERALSMVAGARADGSDLSFWPSLWPQF